MPELPSGTVTFLFTDIEGSTRLLHDLGNAYADVLAEHRRVLRDAFARHGGIEVDTQGDAFFVAFARASDALAAARESQEALDAGPVRVRMGLHTGEPLVGDEGYVGLDVHRAARIAAVGHGGQVLVSQSTRDLVLGEVLRDLGEHRLKDLTAPERIYQLGDAEFPPLKTLDRTNLPVAATPLVGREQELAGVIGLLRDGARLVTVTGPGGSGKTRLALQVAAELVDDFSGNAHFVGLAPVQDPALVESTIAEQVGVRDLRDLHHVRALLVLDNFEHVLAAAPSVAALVSEAGAVTVLATSRVRLQLAAEREFALDPLEQSEAVEFFVTRARAVRPQLVADEAVAEICRRLDRLPLALELAASRVKVLDPALLLTRLERRLPVLTGGARDAPKRQQTLRATIEWSYDLLDPALQRTFRRLAIFRGTFSLEAAEAVAAADLEEIAGLVDWNLLKPIGDGRFLMLETIREYARELFEASDDFGAVSDAHLDLLLALAEEAERELVGKDQLEWYERLAAEQDNLRAALDYALAAGDADRALRLSGSLWRFWWNRGQLEEAAQWYEHALAIADRASPEARARARLGAAHMTEARGDADTTRALLDEAIPVFRASRDSRRLVIALAHRAAVDSDPERALTAHLEALAVAEEAGDKRNIALMKHNVGAVMHDLGDDERAEPMFREALALAREIGDVYLVAGALDGVASVELRRGEPARAAASSRQSIELMWSMHDAHSLAAALVTAAAALRALDRSEVAARLCGARDTLARRHGFEFDRWVESLLSNTVNGLRSELGDAFEPAWSSGAALELEQAVELAVEALAL